MRHERLNRPSWWRRLLRSRLMIAVNLLLVGFIGWSVARAASEGGRADAQYADLQKQIESLDSQNRDYSDTISRLGTSGFVEREARVKLGYQKPGEQVLMLKDGGTAADGSSAGADGPSLTNPQKWWRYFFGG